VLRPKELFVGRLLSREKSIERFFVYLLVKTVVSLLRHTSKYDLATDIASVNNKVSVDLFWCLYSLFVVNLIHNLFNLFFDLLHDEQWIWEMPTPEYEACTLINIRVFLA